MLPYFKKYAIISCVVAVAVPVVVSTVYVLVTGRMMAASLDGLIMLLLLLFGTMMAMQVVFAKRVAAETSELLDLYNEQCDPAALVEKGRAVAEAITVPFNVDGSWFLTYYAQALLDLGRTDAARKILDEMAQSASRARKAPVKAGILMNEAVLATKLEGPAAALKLMDEAYELFGGSSANPADRNIVFVNGQRDLLRAEVEGDAQAQRAFYARAQSDGSVPMRLRVESAWKLARLSYQEGDTATERTMLQFLVDHGNKLALVTPARKQLREL